MILLLLANLALVQAYLNNWFPVVSIKNTDFSNPKQIKILGKDFVLWKKENKIIVQDDICPHRCASLSEGYIDRDTHNLRCAYHGWEFNEKGACKTIPQMTSENIISKKSCVKNYETCEYGDLLWVFLGNITIDHYPWDKYKLSRENAFMRELPYGKYILLENFFDPAHIPFAHHKLQSNRKNALPIEIEKLSNKYDKNVFSLLFNEKNGSEIMRTGLMRYEVPCNYYLKTLKPVSYLNGINIFIVPIDERNTRIFIIYDLDYKSKYAKIMSIFPIWARHIFTNRFFDSDTYILNKQEQVILSNNNSYHDNRLYNLPTTSDDSIKLYRKWIRWALPTIPFINKNKSVQSLSREQVLNRFQQHTKHCSSCLKAYKNIKKFKTMFSLFFGTIFVYKKNPIYLLLSFLNYYVMKTFESLFVFQDYVHNEIN